MKNSINTYPYDIAAIILAYLRNEIDEKGQQKLDAWLEEADSHKALFARIPHPRPLQLQRGIKRIPA